MKRRTLATMILLITMAVAAAEALNPDDEQWIAAAARGAGNAGSFWITDLVVANLGPDHATIALTWLERDADNRGASPVELVLDGWETRALGDVILTTFGRDNAAGAIQVEIMDDEEGVISTKPEIVATARIYSQSADGTFGQGFEGLTSRSALSAGGAAASHAVGITDNEDFRANWFGLNITEDATGAPAPAQVMVEVLDEAGDVLTARTFTMPPLAPMLRPVAALGAGDFSDGVLRFTMLAGSGLFGASKIDSASNDPTTLASHWDCDSCAVVGGGAVALSSSRLYVEYNATDEDLGVHGSFDDHGFSELCLFDPDGRQILSLRPRNQLGDLTLANLFFESREPPIDEFGFDELEASFPEGRYTLVANNYDGRALTGYATFSHAIPAPPEVTAPPIVDDPEDPDIVTVPLAGLAVTWLPVTETVQGGPVSITAYEIIVTKEEHDDPNGFSQPIYDVHVAPDRRSLSVAPEFLEPDTVYELEVLSIEASGNQTIEVGFFKTE